MTLDELDRDKEGARAGALGLHHRLPPSLIGEAVRDLRAAIMTGRLPPGRKLVEQDLARDLGVSRASVREVLRALEAERLIELVPNKGPSVASLGAREVNDIEQVWAMLTSEALAGFATTANAADVRALRRRWKLLCTELANDRKIEAIDGINAFFWYIMQRCGNAVLLDVVVSLLSRLNFLRAQSLQDQAWRTACAREIGEILEAVASRDPTSARYATTRHIASTCAAAKAVLGIDAAEHRRGRVGRVHTSSLVIARDDYLDRGLAKRGRRKVRGADQV